jgi:hypothetical protein
MLDSHVLHLWQERGTYVGQARNINVALSKFFANTGQTLTASTTLRINYPRTPTCNIARA